MAKQGREERMDWAMEGLGDHTCHFGSDVMGSGIHCRDLSMRVTCQVEGRWQRCRGRTAGWSGVSCSRPNGRGPCTAEVVHRLRRGQSGCAVTLKLMGSADTCTELREKEGPRTAPRMHVFVPLPRTSQCRAGAFPHVGRSSEAQVWGCCMHSGKAMLRGPGQRRGHI